MHWALRAFFSFFSDLCFCFSLPCFLVKFSYLVTRVDVLRHLFRLHFNDFASSSDLIDRAGPDGSGGQSSPNHTYTHTLTAGRGVRFVESTPD